MMVMVMVMILCLQRNSKWRGLRYMTVLWEYGLRGGVIKWLWCLKLCNIERVCWRKYGWRGRVGVWLRWRGHGSRWVCIVVLEGGWHRRRREVRGARLMKRVGHYRRRGDKEFFYHSFIFFHVAIEVQLCQALWGGSIPACETGSPSACHRSVTRLGILQSSRWATTWSRAREGLSELCL